MSKAVLYRQSNPFVRTNEYGTVNTYEFAVYSTRIDYYVPSLIIHEEYHSELFEIEVYGLSITENSNRKTYCNEIDTGPLTTRMYLLNYLVRTLCRTELQGFPHINWIIDEETTKWIRRYGNVFRTAAEKKLRNQIRMNKLAEISLESMSNRERRLFLNNPFRPK